MTTLRVEAAGATDVGLHRNRNEDAVLLAQWCAHDLLRFSCGATLEVGDEPATFVVADGVGGEEHGNVASRLVVQTFRTLPTGSEYAVRGAAAAARDAMSAWAKANGSGDRMASAVAGLVVSTQGIVVFSSGDCYVGRVSGRYAQLLLGSYEFGSSSTQIDQFIGAQGSPASELVTTWTPQHVTGRFLLMTDGVTRMVSPDVFDTLIAPDRSPSEAVACVVAAVRAAGARDNYTAICVDISADS